jgi:hypothetical protein
MTQSLWVFMSAGVRCAVGLADVARLLVEDRVVPVPFSHPAMAGVLVDDQSGAVPVFDLRGLTDPAGMPRTVPGATVVLFSTAKGPVGLRLDALVGTASTYEARTEPIDVPEALKKTLASAAVTQGEPLAFFSPEAFLASISL